MATKPGAAKGPQVTQVKSGDPRTLEFDGKKADLFINTGRLGKTYLVSVEGVGGRPTLIAMHL